MKPDIQIEVEGVISTKTKKQNEDPYIEIFQPHATDVIECSIVPRLNLRPASHRHRCVFIQ
jgi:hypothetical protein